MGLQRVFDILDIEPDVKDSPTAVPLTEFKKEITFENIAYSYEADRPVLKDVSFRATPSTITAIVGPTGSGKSTVVSLPLRLFDPDSGRHNDRRHLTFVISRSHHSEAKSVSRFKKTSCSQ